MGEIKIGCYVKVVDHEGRCGPWKFPDLIGDVGRVVDINEHGWDIDQRTIVVAFADGVPRRFDECLVAFHSASGPDPARPRKRKLAL
jgi:hypothetical protein